MSENVCTSCANSRWQGDQPVPWLGHLVRTSGALKPGVPALGATCCFLFLIKSTWISNRQKKKRYHMNVLYKRGFKWQASLFSLRFLLIPGQADVADTVSLVAVTGEALMYSPLWFLTAALAPDRQWSPAGWRVPSTGWFIRFAGLKNRFYEEKTMSNTPLKGEEDEIHCDCSKTDNYINVRTV